MARRSITMLSRDASYFGPRRREKPEFRRVCTWDGCLETRALGTPVCLRHAVIIGGLVQHSFGVTLEDLSSPPPDEIWIPHRYVYYLMVGPKTVKIGTTKCLPQRLSSLRTDSQYVVAIERGGMDLERERHLEFAAERIGRREDFRLSDRLKAHIDALAPSRDEIVTEATTPPFGKMIARRFLDVSQ